MQDIEFSITDNIKKLGIEKLTLEDRDFLITWSDGKNSCIDFTFRRNSLSHNIKLIEKALKNKLKDKVDKKLFEDAIQDIEDQLIKRRDEIYELNTTAKNFKNSSDYEREDRSKLLEEISNLRKQFEQSSDAFNEWQLKVKEKYHKLYEITINYYPEAWPILEFCIAVKSIQNIHGNTLPFIGIILAKPSSLKTTVIELFRKYDKTFYSDNFTPNSIMSHNSSLSEEELQKVDMLPKMNNKFVLTPELAPMFTAKDDDLQKVLGIITRIVDGKGYESDSGAQGHRKYSDIMFSWVGAAVEILPKVWKLLSQLGFKLYFFRPTLKEKSIDDLTTIIKDNDHHLVKNKEIEKALLEYLKVFDAAPNTNYSYIDENNLVKIKWNFDVSRNDFIDKEQMKIIEYISQIAKLLAPLRGTVYTSPSKTRKYQRSQHSSNNNNEETEDNNISFQTEQVDYETDSPIIEDPSRAGIVLRNLAFANAISQGRSYLRKEDVKLIIKVALSTTRIHRSKLLDLLLKNNGELATSKIAGELGMSEPSARRTMREFEALGIVETARASGSINSELKIKLKHEFDWFLTEEFRDLCKPSSMIQQQQVNLDHNHNNNDKDIHYNNNNVTYQSLIIKNICNSKCFNTNSKAYDNNNDNNRHTLKANLPPERGIKNNDAYNNKFSYNNLKAIKSTNNEELSFFKENDKNSINIEHKEIENNNPDYFINLLSSEEIARKGFSDSNIQKYSVPQESEYFQHVTLSKENYQKETKEESLPEGITNEILHIIKNENGLISLGYALQLACQKNDAVKEYLKDEKLTARDSRKVRKLFVELNRHPNILVLKRKPELIVKWIENEKKGEDH